MTRSSFIQGALILTGASFVSRILGAVYRIPLTRIIGDEGMGLYQMSHPIYVFIVVLAVSGIPTALSKLVAETAATGSKKEIYKVFYVTLLVLMITGTLGSLFLFVAARYIAFNILHDSRAYMSLVCAAPAVMLVCVTSGFRGFFMGLQRMIPNAVAQVFEQLARIIAMLVLAVMLLPKGVEYAAAGVSFGTVIGNLIGLLVLSAFFLSGRKDLNKPSFNSKAVSGMYWSTGKIVFKILCISLPLAVGGIIGSAGQTLDASLIPARLEAAGFSTIEATALYGQLTGITFMLVSFPGIFSGSLAASLLPIISEAKAVGNLRFIRHRTHQGLRLAIMIGLPASVGLFVLAREITALLFNIPEAGIPLTGIAFGSVLLCINQITAAVLHGLGKLHVPVINLVISSVIRLGLTYYLTGLPQLGIAGAALAGTISLGVQASISLSSIMKTLSLKIDMINAVIKPGIGAALMVIGIKLVYAAGYMVTNNGKISTLAAIAAGALIYILVLFITGAVQQKDIEFIPNIGKPMGRILKTIGLVK
jgi:stage V sporulation protein B